VLADDISVQEFELISHESECMKRKLLSQEDEFRLQNETLMTELGQVSHNYHGIGSARLLFTMFATPLIILKCVTVYWCCKTDFMPQLCEVTNHHFYEICGRH